MDYQKMLVRIYVTGAKNSEERERGRKIAMKVYSNLARRFINPIFTPCYNAIYDFIRPETTIDDRMDEDGHYTKTYFRIINNIAKIFIFLNGGYWFSSKRKVVLRFDYFMTPIDDPTATHEIRNMIFIKGIGE